VCVLGRDAVAGLRLGQRIKSTYMVRDKKLGSFKGKAGHFLSLTLGDQTGKIEAKLWDKAEEAFELFARGDIVEVSGEIKEFRGTPEIHFSTYRVCLEGEFSPRDFLPVSPRDPQDMLAELQMLVKTVREPDLVRLLELFFNDPEWLELYCAAPAAKLNHQAYLGGLLEHSLNVARAASAIAPLYPRAGRDLLVVGAILHDLGKIEEYQYNKIIDYTDEGRLLGHIVMGVRMLEKKIELLPGFPDNLRLKLLHIITSHHGCYEWQSPKKPKFLEAALVHLLDLMDATADYFSQAMDDYSDSGSNWSPWQRGIERQVYRG